MNVGGLAAAGDLLTGNPILIAGSDGTNVRHISLDASGRMNPAVAMAMPSANFTRPADTTAYASGDLIANSVTPGSVVPMSWPVARFAAGSGAIRRARIRKSGTTVTAASFRLHLYASSPTVTNGDNGVWTSTQSGYLGSLSGDMSATAGRVFSNAAQVVATPDQGTEINFALASGQTIFGLLEARGAYTPASAEVFTVELEVDQK